MKTPDRAKLDMLRDISIQTIDRKKSMLAALIIKKQNECIQRTNNLTLEQKTACEGICMYVV
jgi:hypothetical protein